MKIIITSEDELYDVAAKAIHILTNLRFFTKEWEKEHGVELKQRKKHWEEKADELISELGTTQQKHPSSIKIENNKIENK